MQTHLRSTLSRAAPAMALFAIAAVARLLWIGEYSAWFDEPITLHHSESLSTILTRRYNAAFYLLLIHGWRNAFGDPIVAIRAFSLIFGMLSIGLVALISDRLFSHARITWGAAFLYALLPHALWHSREGRMYSLWTFLYLLSVYAVLKLRDRWWSAIPLVLAFFTHAYTAFFAAGLAIAAATRKKAFTTAHLLMLALAVASLGRIYFAVPNPARFLSEFFWRPQTYAVPPAIAITRLGDLFFRIPSAPFSAHAAWTVGLGLSALFTLAIVALWKSNFRREAQFIFFAGVAPYLAATSLPIRNEPRLLGPAVPLLCITFVAALFVVVARRYRIALGTGALALLILSSANYSLLYSTKEDPWNEVCAAIGRDGGQAEFPLVLINEPFLASRFEQCALPQLHATGFPADELKLDRLPALASGHEVIWLVYSHAWYSDPKREWLRALSSSGKFRTQAYRAGPQTELYRFER